MFIVMHVYCNACNAIFDSKSPVLDTLERRKITPGQSLGITTIVAIQMAERVLGVTQRIQMSDTNYVSVFRMVRLIKRL